MMCSGKTVGIRVSDQVSVPMVTGLVRPTVLLPMSAPAWPADQLGSVIAHELAHLKEKEHNKNFYLLCEHMQPNYHQLEFDTRLFLTMLELDEKN